MFRKLITLAAAAGALAAAATGTAQAATNTAATVKPAVTTMWTATTTLTNRPDSGAQGNTWALDNMARKATIKRIGEVAASNCPGTDTGHCYLWDATIADNGQFTTQAGQLAPRTGTLERSLTGPVKGGSPNVQFYSSWKSAKAVRVPTSLDGSGSARQSTTNWVEQFFGLSAVFNSAANPGGPDLGSWSWKYTLAFGSNDVCPNDAWQWVDAANSSGGSLAVDGNILTASVPADC